MRMPDAFALGMSRGKIIFSFVIRKSLRAFSDNIFTGGAVKANGMKTPQ